MTLCVLIVFSVSVEDDEAARVVVWGEPQSTHPAFETVRQAPTEPGAVGAAALSRLEANASFAAAERDNGSPVDAARARFYKFSLHTSYLHPFTPSP